MRKCTKCGAIKELQEFYKNGEGKRGECRVCTKKAQITYYEANKGALLAKGREYNRAHPEISRRSKRKYALIKYNLTEMGVEELLTAQNGLCPICGGTPDSIDHDHITGKVRGILCRWCNVGLGSFKDNPGWLRAAADYLDRSR